mgnify:FL=1
MRYVRFMSIREMRNYADGKTMENNVEWSAGINKCGSKGFCFFDDSVKPEDRIEYLTGVVDMDVVAVFEPIRDKKLIESYGMYRDPEEDMPEDIFEVFFKPVPTMRIKEYCTEKYSIRDMKLVQVGKIMSARLRKIEWVTVESGRQARR